NNNNCSNNNQNGILLYNKCSNNNISENTCSDNGVNGIKLEMSCENNNLFKNSISKNEIGIFLNHCYYTDMSQNTIENNDIGIGVDNNSDLNNITKNIINNNTEYGIVIIQNLCEYNLIFNNNFIRNKVHAKNDGNNNDWDNGIIGNYWDDYIGKDPDDDGIGSVPYLNITGIIGGQDNYPIWWDAPALYIVKPKRGEEFGEDSPTFRIKVDEGRGYYFWYEFIGTGIESSVTQLSGNLNLSKSGTINQNLWNRLPNSPIIIRFYVKDTQGFIGYKDVLIIKNVPDDDDDDWKTKEGIPLWLQAIFMGMISVCIGFIIIIFYNEYKKRKKLLKKDIQ
ncbi:MAG: hypothetical protein EU540_08465, partial [Promethearchaeota archaeon]